MLAYSVRRRETVLGLLHGWLSLGLGAAVPSRVLAVVLAAGVVALIAGALLLGRRDLETP